MKNSSHAEYDTLPGLTFEYLQTALSVTLRRNPLNIPVAVLSIQAVWVRPHLVAVIDKTRPIQACKRRLHAEEGRRCLLLLLLPPVALHLIMLTLSPGKPLQFCLQHVKWKLEDDHD